MSIGIFSTKIQPEFYSSKYRGNPIEETIERKSSLGWRDFFFSLLFHDEISLIHPLHLRDVSHGFSFISRLVVSPPKPASEKLHRPSSLRYATALVRARARDRAKERKRVGVKETASRSEVMAQTPTEQGRIARTKRCQVRKQGWKKKKPRARSQERDQGASVLVPRKEHGKKDATRLEKKREKKRPRVAKKGRMCKSLV